MIINESFAKKPFAQILICLLVCGTQGSAFAQKPTKMECETKVRADSPKLSITSDIEMKEELDNVIDSHKDLDDDVSFDVRDGVAMLKGVVDNNSEKVLAGKLAQDIDGVIEVEDLIRVED